MIFLPHILQCFEFDSSFGNTPIERKRWRKKEHYLEHDPSYEIRKFGSNDIDWIKWLFNSPPPSMVQYHSECWSSLFCALFSVNSIEWNIEMTSSFHSDDLEYFQVLQIWTKQFVWIFIWTIFVTSKERNSVDKRKELEMNEIWNRSISIFNLHYFNLVEVEVEVFHPVGIIKIEQSISKRSSQS